MPNENMTIDTKLHPINLLHISNHAKHAKYIITSNAKNKSNESANLTLVQEMKVQASLCKCVDSPETLLHSYTKYGC